MADTELIPYAAYALDTPDTDLAAVERGSTRVAPAAYDRQAREILAFHTGSSETFLTIEQEHELAARIQEGHTARAEREALEAQIAAEARLSPKLKDQLFETLPKTRAGREAERTLIECNLRLSSYLARASMNILPSGDQQAIGADSKAGMRRRALLNDHLPWLPRDFTSLKSRHANLDDRMQVANMALIKAARTFKPGITSRGGNLVSFLSFAAPIIKTELTRYVRGGSPDSHEKPVHVPPNILEAIPRARSVDWQEYFTPKERQELLDYDQLQEMSSLDDLYFAGAADEEIDLEDNDLSLLWAGESIAAEDDMDPFIIAAKSMRDDLIHQALSTLSERETGVLRLRYGLVDDVPRTLDEIALVYGVSKERIRKIERDAMSKMRHSSRSEALQEFLYLIEGGDLPMRSGDIIKADRTIGHSVLQLMVAPREVQSGPDILGRESWQAYPGEAWGERIRRMPPQLKEEYEATAQRLHELILSTPIYTFQRSFAEDVGSPYPRLAVERINQAFGRDLTPYHIADFWNQHLEPFLQHLSEQLGEDASPERAVQLVSRLLAERMGDSDTVELRIPENLQGQLSYVGAWLSHGTVKVLGNPGNHAGYEMSSLARLQVEGSVGHFAGARMRGKARLEVDGDVGDFLGLNTSGSASILVNGDVGNYCGHRMNSRGVLIEILGKAGENLGYGASNGEIIVSGQIGSIGTSDRFRGRIAHKR